MRVAYINCPNVEWCKAVLGASKQYYYTPNHEWNSESHICRIYHDAGCTRPVLGEYLKARFELQYYINNK